MPDQRSPGLQVQVHQRGNAVIIAPVGEIDLTASPQFRKELKRLHDAKPPAATIVVDLARVPYMDSSGVATLVESMQLSRRAKTRLVLCGMTSRVRSIFEIARLDSVFTIVTTVDDAFAGA